MKAWQVAHDWSIEGMELADLPEPVQFPQVTFASVLLHVHAERQPQCH